MLTPISPKAHQEIVTWLNSIYYRYKNVNVKDSSIKNQDENSFDNLRPNSVIMSTLYDKFGVGKHGYPEVAELASTDLVLKCLACVSVLSFFFFYLNRFPLFSLLPHLLSIHN